MHGTGILSIIIWLPVGGGLLTLLIGNARARLARWFALLVALLTFALCLPLWQGFDTTTSGFQYLERLAWIPQLDAEDFLGVGGVSLSLFLLTPFKTVPVIIARWMVIRKRPAAEHPSFLVLDGPMIGACCAL